MHVYMSRMFSHCRSSCGKWPCDGQHIVRLGNDRLRIAELKRIIFKGAPAN